MTPLRFGRPARQLVGLYHPPATPAPAPHAVLLCNPFGQEAIRAHRLLRVIAERLAREGHAVLRFDYFGTGDSDGDDAEADVAAWVDDVLAASRELERVARPAAVSWFGLRLGGTLAAMASARAPQPPRRLVMWDPVVDGAAYLRELEAAHADALRLDNDAGYADYSRRAAAGLNDGESTEALGFPLTPGLRRQIRDVTVERFDALRSAAATLLAADAPGAAALRERLARHGAPIELRTLDLRIAWATDEAMNTAIVPAEALRAIVESLAA